MMEMERQTTPTEFVVGAVHHRYYRLVGWGLVLAQLHCNMLHFCLRPDTNQACEQ